MNKFNFDAVNGKYAECNERMEDLINDQLSSGSGKLNKSKIAKKLIKEFKWEGVSEDSVRKYVAYYYSVFINNEDLLGESGKPVRKTKAFKQVLSADDVTSLVSKSRKKQVKDKEFVLSAWNDDGYMMDIDQYCEHYKLPRKDVVDYKLVSHTGTPYYNVKFKEHILLNESELDIESIVKKHIKKIKVKAKSIKKPLMDYDVLTYTDVHIGMDTNPEDKAMYSVEWNKESILASCERMIMDAISNKKSNKLIVDELGDFLDGFNAKTTRGGHELPQNMSNDEAFDVALEFKMRLIDGLADQYAEITFNNICNDNHAGSFGYFVNKAFTDICAVKYPYIEINNYRKFLNHYFVGDTCFIITHGKDDTTLKYGFKPVLKSQDIEKIDQYLKQNKIYKKANRIIFKKGDSHQCLFDFASSDDFIYMNYPALSPSSMWVQNNFKKGRRGFVIESFNDKDHVVETCFI